MRIASVAYPAGVVGFVCPGAAGASPTRFVHSESEMPAPNMPAMLLGMSSLPSTPRYFFTASVKPLCTAENTARFSARTFGGPENEPPDMVGGLFGIEAACFSRFWFTKPSVNPSTEPVSWENAMIESVDA